MKHIVSDNDRRNNFKSCSKNKNDDKNDFYLFTFEKD